ncbi:hypothetical protein, partial [Sinorhizobium fredii]|uniref:hypothetical protein n=1 Tax=Rhizobium fredii TaxID=380 RepID=UPI00055E2783
MTIPSIVLSMCEDGPAHLEQFQEKRAAVFRQELCSFRSGCAGQEGQFFWLYWSMFSGVTSSKG